MYNDELFDVYERNLAAITNRFKAVFAHLKAAFCHPSLGSKVHINLQNPNDPIHFMDSFEKSRSKKVTEILEADEKTHLVAYFVTKMNSMSYTIYYFSH